MYSIIEYSSHKIPEDSVIKCIVAIHNALAQELKVKNYSSYESIGEFKKIVLPDIESGRKKLYVAFDNQNEGIVAGFLVVVVGDPCVISLIEADFKLHRKGVGTSLICRVQNMGPLKARIDAIDPKPIAALLQKCRFVKKGENTWCWNR